MSDLTERDEAEEVIAGGIIAFQHTRDYVGHEMLPEGEGWSWSAWTNRAEAFLARHAMSEARDRLIQGIGTGDGSRLRERTGEFLDYFIARPDDLVEVLVREHGIESVRTWVGAMVDEFESARETFSPDCRKV